MSTSQDQVSTPLTEQDLTQINEALDRSRGAESIIARARQAGIDVTDLERRNNESRERLRKIKTAFFPGR